MTHPLGDRTNFMPIYLVDLSLKMKMSGGQQTKDLRFSYEKDTNYQYHEIYKMQPAKPTNSPMRDSFRRVRFIHPIEFYALYISCQEALMLSQHH